MIKFKQRQQNIHQALLIKLYLEILEFEILIIFQVLQKVIMESKMYLS